MDITELKKLLKNSTSVLIMDQGSPDLVIMDYSSYKNLVHDNSTEVAVSRTSQKDNTPNSPPLMPTDYNGSWLNEGVSADYFATKNEEPARIRESEIVERLNREIMLLKQQIELEESREL